MSWLKKPREFRLLDELDHTDGNISFGPKDNDITLTEWIGTFYLPNRDIIVQFQMTCGQDFPNVSPIIKFTLDPKIRLPALTNICDKTGLLKDDMWIWDQNKSICENTSKVTYRVYILPNDYEPFGIFLSWSV